MDNTYAEYTFQNGDRYEGNWSHGMLCGKGKYIKAGGKEYLDGTWDDDKPVGLVEHQEPDGRVYVGQFKTGLRHGRGELRLPADGGKFQCEFRDGVMVGKVSRISYSTFDGLTGRRIPPAEAAMIPGYINTLNQEEPGSTP